MTKKPLGRGLSALLEVSDSSVSRRISESGSQLEERKVPQEKNSITFLSISSLVPGAFQPRKKFDEGDLEALSVSISQQGVLQPLLVRPKQTGNYALGP